MISSTVPWLLFGRIITVVSRVEGDVSEKNREKFGSSGK